MLSSSSGTDVAAVCLRAAAGFGNPPLETCDSSTDESSDVCIVFLEDADDAAWLDDLWVR